MVRKDQAVPTMTPEQLLNKPDPLPDSSFLALPNSRKRFLSFEELPA